MILKVSVNENSLLNKYCSSWLNGLTAHDSIEISLFQAYIHQHNYGITFLPQMFLNFSIESNGRIAIDGYNLIRSDHPSYSKRGGVCI